MVPATLYATLIISLPPAAVASGVWIEPPKAGEVLVLVTVCHMFVGKEIPIFGLTLAAGVSCASSSVYKPEG